MDERKKRVLNSIIKDYLATAEPVGSRAVAKKCGLGVSPATIRNEMSDLEEEGYIEQPHTSAGRRPSHKGYRYYVDNLMEKEKLTKDEINSIRQLFPGQIEETDTLMHQCCQLISRLTNYAAMVVYPGEGQGTLEKIKLLPVDDSQILAVVLANNGVVKHRLLHMPVGISSVRIDYLETVLQEKLKGKSMDDLGHTLLRELINTIGSQEKTILQTIELLEHMLLNGQKEKVFSAGVFNMLSQPEFKDVDKLKDIFTFLEEENKVKELLNMNKDGINVAIGDEIQGYNVKDCSMVVVSYHTDSGAKGSIGVLGPTRMSYPKTISLMELFSEELSKVFLK